MPVEVPHYGDKVHCVLVGPGIGSRPDDARGIAADRPPRRVVLPLPGKAAHRIE